MLPPSFTEVTQDHASFLCVVRSEETSGLIHCMVLYWLLAEIVKPALVRGLHYQHTLLYSVKMSCP